MRQAGQTQYSVGEEGNGCCKNVGMVVFKFIWGTISQDITAIISAKYAVFLTQRKYLSLQI